MCIICVLYVYYMCMCVLYVYVCIICVLYVYYMCIICVLDVYVTYQDLFIKNFSPTLNNGFQYTRKP